MLPLFTKMLPLILTKCFLSSQVSFPLSLQVNFLSSIKVLLSFSQDAPLFNNRVLPLFNQDASLFNNMKLLPLLLDLP
ncbi:hypothetical protein TVAGG3_0723040 [Trichomonas vaginalis G3]|uniref:hypothetical protein n=1 Tax=Trichomonas vaginalis (strain ATCC PRA-98 / G3) TaxID=412133 RepID=UPI0021E566F9|nr:hypothetical protein TVAGG3_0723040 [Trichomonas vaginalis G3]KAI5510717.1 hypothetical protein TVAGG3_0723040 [Trichomonas vaginalis G3]